MSLVLILTLVIVGFNVVFGAILWSIQRKQLVFPAPPPYGGQWERGLPEGTLQLAFSTEDGQQRSFYLPPLDAPAEGEAPQRLWVAFNGNASDALAWLDLAQTVREADRNAAFLLVDYPGYGASEGETSRDGIIRNAEQAFAALAVGLAVPEEALERDLGVVGYSLGCAAGLEFAVRHPVRRMVLYAPFTSLLDMAQLTVMWPYYHLLRDRFDNRARLDELRERGNLPAILLAHGTADQVVPYSQGKELAETYPELIDFRTFDGVDHGWIVDAAKIDVIRFMIAEETAPALTAP